MASKQPDASAASRLQAYSGRPAIGRRFLPGIDFEPPRSGSSATQRISADGRQAAA